MAFSNFSMNSDGTSDEIDFGNVLGSFVSAGDAGCEFSLSFWLKTTSVTSNIYSLNTVNGNNYRLGILSEKPYFYYGGGAIITQFKKLDGSIAPDNIDAFDGNWHHWFIYVPSGATPAGIDIANMKLYIDTDSAPFNSTAGSVDVANGQFNEFSIRGNTWGTFNGNICEIAMWAESDQTANLATIYGGGTPPDLTALSPTNWWRTGQKAEFGGTNWTVEDQTSSFDGTSVNMGVDSRHGNAPNSINNGITVNIGSGDIVAP